VMVFSEAVITLWFIGVASCYVALGHVPPPSTFNNLIIFFSVHFRAAQSLTATLRGCILQTYLFAVLFRDILYAINNFRVVLCLPSHRILATPLQCGSPARDHWQQLVTAITVAHPYTPFTGYNRLSNRVVQPVWQQVVSCKNGALA